jgi:Uma2 family endonuclease
MTTLSVLSNLSFTPSPSAVKHWTVEEYHRMGELGLFQSGERTELIAGQILLMSPKGALHVTALQLLGTILETELDGSALIRTQCGGVLDYADRHPQPQEIYLVVEVADLTLKYDCDTKDKIYAKTEIVEYWVLDVKGRQLHIFRDPSPIGYTSHTILRELANASPVAFPATSISIQSMLSPK